MNVMIEKIREYIDQKGFERGQEICLEIWTPNGKIDFSLSYITSVEMTLKHIESLFYANDAYELKSVKIQEMPGYAERLAEIELANARYNIPDHQFENQMKVFGWICILAFIYVLFSLLSDFYHQVSIIK